MMRGALGACLGLAVWAAAVSPAAAQAPLATLPLSDPAYVQLQGLIDQGCGAARVSAFRPFLVRDIRRAVSAAKGEPRCRGPLLEVLRARFAVDSVAPGVHFGAKATAIATALHHGVYRPLWRDVRPTSAGEAPLVGEFAARLSWADGAKLAAVAEPYVETSYRNDPTVRANPFRHTSGILDFREAYLTGALGRLVLSVGRSPEAWLGQGSESLVLSANGPALDRISASANWKHFEVQALVASINDVVLSPRLDSFPDSVGAQRWHRMLLAHALTWRPSRSVELTAGETALLPRRGGGVDLAYVNPLMIYQVTQNDRTRDPTGGNANLTAFGSVRANVGPTSWQGELLIDDLQIDARDRARYPNLLGWNLRGTAAVPLPIPASVGLQYRRVDSYTYLEQTYASTYQQYDQPIGSELGPDADIARAVAELWPSGRFRLEAGLARWRHGASRIDQRPPHDRTRVGTVGQPYPSSTADRPAVQGAWLGDLTAQWLGTTIPISVNIELARITNVNNQPAPTGTYGRIAVEASYRFRYP